MNRRHALSLFTRLYSTSNPPGKSTAKLVAELRKLTDVPISTARDALVASQNDPLAALEWLRKNLLISGAKKAAKLRDRHAGEGLIGLSVLESGRGREDCGIRAAMVEVNCETDFVAQNALFGRLVSDIAHTAAYMSEEDSSWNAVLAPYPLDVLREAPLIPEHPNPTFPPRTVADSIQELIAKVGENVTLRRAVVAVQSRLIPPSEKLAIRLVSYAHGSPNSTQLGHKAMLGILGLRSIEMPDLLQSDKFMEDLGKLERALGRQIIGYQVQSVQSSSEEISGLYDTPFTLFGGSQDRVEDVLRQWSRANLVTAMDTNIADSPGVHVLEFAHWNVGEALTLVTQNS